MEASRAINLIMNAVYCGDIFEKDETKVKQQYHEYAKLIHPDLCRSAFATEAITKLNKLYSSALKNLSNGTWKQSNQFYIDLKNNIAYRNKKEFELGTRYVGDYDIIYEFKSDKAKYSDQYSSMLLKVNYYDSAMRNVYQKRMPYMKRATNSVIQISKKPGEFPMDLFLDAYGEKLCGRDIAWMISRMVDLCCFLRYNHIVMNSISPNTLFIDPANHSLFFIWRMVVCG